MLKLISDPWFIALAIGGAVALAELARRVWREWRDERRARAIRQSLQIYQAKQLADGKPDPFAPEKMTRMRDQLRKKNAATLARAAHQNRNSN